MMQKRKGWIDEEGKLYIEFPIQEIMICSIAAKEKQSGYWKNWMNKRGWG